MVVVAVLCLLFKSFLMYLAARKKKLSMGGEAEPKLPIPHGRCCNQAHPISSNTAMNPAELLVIMSKETDEQLHPDFLNNKFPLGSCIILFADGHPCRLSVHLTIIRTKKMGR